MKKSFNSTLVLLGCLVLLLGWYVGYEKKLRPQNEQAEEKAKELVSLDRSLITDITLERAKNALTDESGKTATPPPSEIETIHLRKNGVDWTILKPIEYPGDNTQVESLVTTGVTTKYERIVDEHPKDLEEFGLKTPLIKASFRKDATSPATTVLIGRDTPTGNAVYAKIEGKDPVYRVSRIARTSFEKPLKDLRDKTVVGAPSSQVTQVEIGLPNESIVAKKDEKGTWQMLRENLPADPTEWNKTLNGTLDAKAKDFLPAKDLKKYGLQPPQVKVEIEKGDKSKLHIVFGQVGDKAYAKPDNKDVVFEIDKDVVSKLKQPGSTYTDRHVASFNRFDAARLRLTRADGTLELFKDMKKSVWSLGEEQSQPAEKRTEIDKSKVDTLLTNLQDMKAEKYLKGHAPVKEGDLKIEVWENSATGDPKVVLNLKHEGKNVVGERGGINVPFQLAAADFKKIDVGKKDLTKEKKENPDPKKSASQNPEKGKG